MKTILAILTCLALGACTTTTTVTTGGKNPSVSVTKKEPNYNVVAIIGKVLVDSLVRPIIGEGRQP